MNRQVICFMRLPFWQLLRPFLSRSNMQGMNQFQAPESMIGKLLVASTTVQDPILSRSVSLVVHQDEQQVYAVLLNRPMAPPKGVVKLVDSSGESVSLPASKPADPNADGNPSGRLPRQSGSPQSNAQQPGAQSSQSEDSSLAQPTAADVSKSQGTIHFGGPLSGPVVAVHNSSELAEAEAGRGVYVAAQRDLLEALLMHRPAAYRLIVGHLGWSLEQLRSEREAGYWHVIDATEDDVFTGDQELWSAVIRRATGASLAHWVGIDTPPERIECN
jgi:putative transcriptional regulator